MAADVTWVQKRFSNSRKTWLKTNTLRKSFNYFIIIRCSEKWGQVLSIYFSLAVVIVLDVFWRVSIPLTRQFICFKNSSYTLNENKDFLKGCDGEQFTDWGISQRRQLIQFQFVGSSFRNTYSRQYSHQSAIGENDMSLLQDERLVSNRLKKSEQIVNVKESETITTDDIQDYEFFCHF